MNDEGTVRFAPRWKEELVGTLGGRSFVIGMTMGITHVYLPTRGKWEAAAPDWAKGIWEKVREDLEKWCGSQKYPMSVVENTWMFFEPEAA